MHVMHFPGSICISHCAEVTHACMQAFLSKKPDAVGNIDRLDLDEGQAKRLQLCHDNVLQAMFDAVKPALNKEQGRLEEFKIPTEVLAHMLFTEIDCLKFCMTMMQDEKID